MALPVEGERRRSLRYDVSCQLVAQEYSSAEVSSSAPCMRGKTQNLSRGGLCVRLESQCSDSSLMRCDIVLSECAVGIPTLTRVRWVRNDLLGCSAGLEFLLH